MKLTFSLKGLAKPKESKLFLSIAPFLKEKRTQQFSTLSFTFITIAFFGIFAINPTVGTIVDLQKQLNDNTFVDQQMQKKISNITSLQTQYQQIQSNLTPVYDVVPVSPAIEVFVGQVHKLAAQNNIQLNRVQTLPVDVSPRTIASAKYLAYAFALEGQGFFTDLQKYVTSLATFNRLISFDTVDFTRVGRLDPTFRMLIRGKTYFKQGGGQ